MLFLFVRLVIYLLPLYLYITHFRLSPVQASYRVRFLSAPAMNGHLTFDGMRRDNNSQQGPHPDKNCFCMTRMLWIYGDIPNDWLMLTAVSWKLIIRCILSQVLYRFCLNQKAGWSLHREEGLMRREHECVCYRMRPFFRNWPTNISCYFGLPSHCVSFFYRWWLSAISRNKIWKMQLITISVVRLDLSTWCWMTPMIRRNWHYPCWGALVR